MQLRSRQRAIAFSIAFGACLVALAVALNVGWIILNWRQVAQLVFGVIFFMAIIVGIVLNTIFLVREIPRNEQHDGFINAVTHELKTPIASIASSTWEPSRRGKSTRPTEKILFRNADRYCPAVAHCRAGAASRAYRATAASNRPFCD